MCYHRFITLVMTTTMPVVSVRQLPLFAWSAAILGLLVLLYRDVVYGMGLQWHREPDYAHGFLVPLIAAYFVWEKRESLGRLIPAPDVRGAFLLGLGLGMLLLGSVGAELFLQRSSLIVVLAGLVWLLLGPAFLRALAWPLAFLFFMVPLPAIVMNQIAFPLQLFAATTASFCLSTVGIPVLREGNVIVLAQTTLEVAEACSGIRSLQALLALGAVYGYMTQTQASKRWALLVASIPIAIAANVFRVTGTGLLAHFVGLKAAEGFYHTFAGWLVFVVAMVLLLGCGSLLSRIGKRPAAPPASSPA